MKVGVLNQKPPNIFGGKINTVNKKIIPDLIK
jgi:hypothetical protein